MNKEEHVIILDYLPNGYPLERKMMPIAQAVGEENLILLELVPRRGTSLEIGERVYIGDGKREKVYYILGRLHREKITETAKNRLQEFIKEVVKRKPRTKADLLQVEGFNNRMFNKIGNDILEAIERYSEAENSKQRDTDIPMNIKETYNLLSKKYTLNEISQLRKLSEAIISMQIETILEYYPESEIDFLFDVESNERINEEIKKGYSSLKELKERK